MPPDDTAAETPEKPEIPGYEIDSLLGSGGMGIVWRARDLTLKREVAVKVLREKFAANSATAVRFVEEAQITSQLQHPGIPAIYQVGLLSNDRPFLAMKLIKGRTLEELMRGGEPINHLAVFEAMAQAVGFAHAHNVIHRDLKPTNIMVGAFGEVQVMDWGLAKILGAPPTQLPSAMETRAPTVIQSLRDSSSHHTQAGSVLGTPAFMAPEQAIGMVEQIDRTTDVFGLGGILCAMLTGQPPYIGSDAESTREMAARARLDQAYVRLDASGAMPGLIALAKECLAPEKKDRPSGGEAVARRVAALRLEAVERARLAELERARAEVQVIEEAKRQRAKRMAVGAIATVLALGLIGTSIGFYLAVQARDAESARAESERAAKEVAAELAISERLAKEDAAAKQKLAEKNLDTAHELTVGLIGVTEQILPSVPETDTTRLKLTAAAVKAFEQFALQRPASPKLKEWAGNLSRYKANLQRLTGDFAAAEGSYQDSAASIRANGGAPEQLALTLIDYATLLRITGRLTEAANLLAGTEAELRKVPAARAGESGMKRMNATIQLERSALEYNLGHLTQALAAADRALAIFKELPSVNKAGHYIYDPLLQADALRLRYIALRELNRPDDASAAITEGRAALKAIADQKFNRIHVDDYFFVLIAFESEATRSWMEDPKPARKEKAKENFTLLITRAKYLCEHRKGIPQYQLALAQVETLRGEVSLAQDHADEAKKDFIAAAARLTDLARGQPNYPYYQSELGRAHLGLMRVAQSSGDTAAAATHLDNSRKALTIASGASPDDIWITRSLAEVKAIKEPDPRPDR